ncbi:unnamed protein product [Leuciscus chuanchicus]
MSVVSYVHETPSSVGSPRAALAESRARAWPPECRSRQTVQEQHSPGRMVPAPSDSPATVAPVRQGVTTGNREDQGNAPLGAPHSPTMGEPNLVPRASEAVALTSLADPGQERSPLSSRRIDMASPPRALVSARVGNQRIPVELSEGVINTITQSRAPSTRRLYTSKWSVFTKWCATRSLDPRTCGVSRVLSFLQELLDKGRSPSTLKVYVAAIAAFAETTRSHAIGRNELIIRFLRGARRMNPPRPPSVPIWDLSLVLEALKAFPFEPLDSVDLKYLSLKTVFLIALASVKRVGDLHALSVTPACLEFGPNEVILKPRHGYVPKAIGTPFRAQIISLSALPASDSDDSDNLLCPVRALRVYITRSAAFRRSEQLFVSFGGRTKGLAASKQSLSRWIVDSIAAAYASKHLQCPMGIRAHSTRGMASSWAWSSWISIHDICMAAGWASPSTFVLNFDAEMVFCCCLLSLFLWFRVSPANANGWNNDVPASVVGLSGSCVEIPCTFRYPAKPHTTYTGFTGVWYTENYESNVFHTDTSKISEAFKGRTKLTGDLHKNKCSLKISSLRNSDTGPFMFRIEIENLDKYTYAAKKVSITVKESPEQPTVSVKDEVTSGNPVTATCTVFHSCPSDLPDITWSHDGDRSSPSQPQSHGEWKVTSYNLTFTPSREDHNKNLSCSAKFSGKTVTGYKMLKVKYPPYNVTVVTKSSVKENDSAELTCSSNSNPPANSYQWFSLKGPLQGNGSTYKLEKVSRHAEAISCTAINTVGRNNSSPRKLNILYPPYNVTVVTKPSVKENDSAELTCSSNSNPPADSYQWFSLNGPLQGNGSTYKLEKVSRHAEAISCTAINTVGRNNSSPRKLNILYPPEIKNESTCQGAILTVCDCIVDSNPPSEVKWFGPDFSKTFPSSSIKQNESLTIFTVQSWQGLPETVQCFANNSLGSSSFTLEAPQNGIIIYIAVASAILVVLVGVLVYVVRRHRVFDVNI